MSSNSENKGVKTAIFSNRIAIFGIIIIGIVSCINIIQTGKIISENHRTNKQVVRPYIFVSKILEPQKTVSGKDIKLKIVFVLTCVGQSEARDIKFSFKPINNSGKVVTFDTEYYNYYFPTQSTYMRYTADLPNANLPENKNTTYSFEFKINYTDIFEEKREYLHCMTYHVATNEIMITSKPK